MTKADTELRKAKIQPREPNRGTKVQKLLRGQTCEDKREAANGDIRRGQRAGGECEKKGEAERLK